MVNIVDLTNKKILVTGASSGIGRATCILLSKVGASVVLVGRDEGRLKDTLNDMDDDQKHKYFISDLSESDTIPQLIQNAVGYDGKKLDGLVHSAGIAEPVPIQVINIKSILAVMKINYYAFLFLVKEYAKKKNNDGGSIVGLSSANTHFPSKCMTLYAGSKMALEGSITTLAQELAPKNIRINSVVPGDTDTPMKQAALKLNPELVYSQLLPTAKPEDIANIIVFLLSNASSYVTGRHYFADGCCF